MRKGVSVAAGLAVLAAISWNAPPAQAMTIAAPAALKGPGDSRKLTEPVRCWDCGYYGGYRPYYQPFYRPYYRPYYSGYSVYGRYYRPYRPYYQPYRGGGYGYGYYRPRPRFHVGPGVYWY